MTARYRAAIRHGILAGVLWYLGLTSWPIALALVAGLLTYWLSHEERGIDLWRRAVNAALYVWYRYAYPVVQQIRAARKQGSPQGPRTAHDRVILVPDAAGPVVESRDTKYPVPLSHVPIRSSKAQAKRDGHAYAESVVGHELTWKRARKLLAEWDREGRKVATS